MNTTSLFASEKFGLLVDLGTITVPDDYEHANRLGSFNEKYHDQFYYYNEIVTDQNFQNPSHTLRPGERLWVRAFKQVVSGQTTSEERIAFLESQNAVFVGAQGASLIFERKLNLLPKDYWYASFDKKERLWKDTGGLHRVPVLFIRSGGQCYFRLGFFEKMWHSDRAFLSFCN